MATLSWLMLEHVDNVWRGSSVTNSLVKEGENRLGLAPYPTSWAQRPADELPSHCASSGAQAASSYCEYV